MKKRALSTLLVLCMALTLLPGTVWAAQETTTSGTCGDNVTWDYDVNTETLTISGTGAMYDYDCEWGENPPPYLIWNKPPYTESGNNDHFIRSVVVSEGITHIGKEAFGSFTSLGVLSELQNVQLPSTLETIGYCAFTSASSLTSISLPSGLRSIGAYAFSGAGLTSLHIPASTTEIGDGQSLRELNAVTVDSGNPKFIAVDSVLYQENSSSSWELLIYPCKKTDKTYIMPDQVDTIPEEAFARNTYLETVTLSSNLNVIPHGAFDSCRNLTSVTLPEGITEIASTAFWFCDNLSRLDIPSTVQDFSSGITPGDGWLEPGGNLSVYFYSYKAPIFDDGVAVTRYSSSHNSKVTIYYPQNAVGWDDVQRQEDVRRAVSAGILEFQPWAYEAPAPAPQVYTVSYDLNGGVGTVPDPSEYQEKSTVSISPAVPTREGYTFVGWSDGITTYQAGQNFVMPSRTVTLTAQWEQASSTVAPMPNDNAVFIKQQSGKTCTLATATMMVRRRAFLDGISDWNAITEAEMRKIAWNDARGFIETFNYRGITGGTEENRYFDSQKDGLAKKKKYLISLLQQHPEGIGVYSYMSKNKRHAVLLTDYDASTDTFYCADPSDSVGHGRIRLDQCYITKWGGKSQAGVLSVLHRIYYVAKDVNRKTLVSSQISSHCPVDMIFSIGGTILDSRTVVSGISGNNFASMTVSGTGVDRSIDVQIKGDHINNYDTDVKLVGTGTGEMTFTVEHLFSDGSIERNTFEQVPISQTFTAETSGCYPQSSVVLSVSDSSEETVWVANPNESAIGPYTSFDDVNIDNVATTPTFPCAPSIGKPSIGKPSTSAPSTTTDKSEQPAQPVVTVPSAAAPLPFTDVDSSAYYYDAVRWAVERGITSGTSPTTFSPDATCTRAQMVSFLWSAAGSPKVNGNNPFTDVLPGTYYYDAVLWAVEQGVTTGVSDTAFSPNDAVTRAQTVTFLYRAAGFPSAGGSNPFMDVPSDAFFTSAVQWAVNRNVTMGTSDYAFSPYAQCTRAQIVTFLYRDRASGF